MGCGTVKLVDSKTKSSQPVENQTTTTYGHFVGNIWKYMTYDDQPVEFWGCIFQKIEQMCCWKSKLVILSMYQKKAVDWQLTETGNLESPNWFFIGLSFTDTWCVYLFFPQSEQKAWGFSPSLWHLDQLGESILGHLLQTSTHGTWEQDLPSRMLENPSNGYKKGKASTNGGNSPASHDDTGGSPRFLPSETPKKARFIQKKSS